MVPNKDQTVQYRAVLLVTKTFTYILVTSKGVTCWTVSL